MIRPAMDSFEYKNGTLHCQGVSVADIANQVGTPVYIYSAETLLHHYRTLRDAYRRLDLTICYSVKGLSNIHILKLLAEEGCGFDIVSGGELARVQAAGGDVSRVVFAGVAKTDDEIHQALEAGIGMFNVESEQELENLSAIAAELGKATHAALRVNPDVFDPKTHAYTTTGKKETKFGIDIDRAIAVYERFRDDEFVTLDGLDLHIGSPIYSPAPYVQAIEKALGLIEQLGDVGVEIKVLDIGGGYAADYETGKSPAATEYADAILELLKDTGLKVIIEPGRFISCNAGILLSKVLYRKQGGEKRFVIVDAAMTDLIRPALYQAEHFIYPARLAPGQETPERRIDFSPPGGEVVDIVGGVCESSDVLGYGRALPPVGRGDLLAIFSAGAYGFAMSSQYNSRPRAAEVLIEGDTWRVIRRRETYDDLMASERLG
jgi:diaminopimelate decarboxylase